MGSLHVEPLLVLEHGVHHHPQGQVQLLLPAAVPSLVQDARVRHHHWDVARVLDACLN